MKPIDTNLAWEAEQARITLFTMSGQTVRLPEFKALTGSDPVSTEASRQGATTLETRSGLFAGGILTINSQPGRADLMVGPSPSGEMPERGYFVFGTPDATIDALARLQPLLGSRALRSTRVAVGLVLLLPMPPSDSVGQVFRRMVKYLRDIPDSTSDIDFRINLHTGIDLKSRRIQINRVVRWHLVTVQIAHASLGPGGAVGFQSTQPVRTARMEIDINTVPQQRSERPFSGEQIKMLLSQFIALTRTIANRGYPE